MNWEEMTDKNKTGLVLEHVTGHFVLGAIATGWRTPDLRAYKADRFHWPIAFWNSDGECWMTRDSGTDPVPFDPLHDMNDVWHVVRKMNEPTPGYDVYARFIDALEKIVGSNLFFDLFYCDKDGDHLTPECICKAALQALGVDVR
jgi:hypothetical protein